MNTSLRILHSGAKAQDTEESRNHVLQDPYVYVVCLGLKDTSKPRPGSAQDMKFFGLVWHPELPKVPS